MALFRRPQGARSPEAIRSPATAVTVGSGTAAVIATVIIAVDGSFKAIFGDDANARIKAAMIIAIIAAWALIAVADIIGRAIAKAAADRVSGTERVARLTAATAPTVAVLPTAVSASRVDGADAAGYLAVASRVVAGDDQVLLVKGGAGPVWVNRDRVDFSS